MLHLESYHLFHAPRAKLLVRVGDVGAALASYDRAIEFTTNEAESCYVPTGVRSSDAVPKPVTASLWIDDER